MLVGCTLLWGVSERSGKGVELGRAFGVDGVTVSPRYGIGGMVCSDGDGFASLWFG